MSAPVGFPWFLEPRRSDLQLQIAQGVLENMYMTLSVQHSDKVIEEQHVFSREKIVPLIDDVETFQFFMQMTALKADLFSGLGDVVFVFLQLVLQVLPFKQPLGLLEVAGEVWAKRRAGGDLGRRCLGGEKEPDLVAAHRFIRTHDDQPLNEIAQFPHITRPAVFSERCIGLFGK